MKKTKEYTKFAFSAVGADEHTLVGTAYENCRILDNKLTSSIMLKNCLNKFSNVITVPSGDIPAQLFCLYRRKGGNMVPYLAILYKSWKMYYYDTELNNGSGDWVEDNNFETVTGITNIQEEAGSKRTCFYNTNGAYYYATNIVGTSSGKVTSIGCYHRGRLFVSAGGNKIVYTSPYNYSGYDATLENGGYLILPSDKGEIVAMASLRGALYVFCEYGIYEIDAVGSARSFVVSTSSYVGDKILGETVTACGEKCICFVAYNGIFSFDGKTVKRIAKNLSVNPYRHDKDIQDKGVYHNGYYHVSYITNNYLLESIMINLDTEVGCLTNMPMGLSVINGQAYCVENSQIKRVGFELDVLPEYIKGVFKVETDFGTSKRKTIRRVWVKGDGTFQLSITADNAIKTMDCTARQEAPRRFDVNLSAEKFELTLEMTQKTRVDSIKVEYETIE